jgi:hypothetical protein
MTTANTTAVATGTLVAYITLDSAREMRRPQESAAAYETILVPAGTYPVEIRRSASGWPYLASCFRGTITASGYGSRVYTDRIGQEVGLTLQPYRYQLRAGAFAGGSVEIVNAEALDAYRGGA